MQIEELRRQADAQEAQLKELRRQADVQMSIDQGLREEAISRAKDDKKYFWPGALVIFNYLYASRAWTNADRIFAATVPAIIPRVYKRACLLVIYFTLLSFLMFLRFYKRNRRLYKFFVGNIKKNTNQS